MLKKRKEYRSSGVSDKGCNTADEHPLLKSRGRWWSGQVADNKHVPKTDYGQGRQQRIQLIQGQAKVRTGSSQSIIQGQVEVRAGN